jgi:hypothetical protein
VIARFRLQLPAASCQLPAGHWHEAVWQTAALANPRQLWFSSSYRSNCYCFEACQAPFLQAVLNREWHQPHVLPLESCTRGLPNCCPAQSSCLLCCTQRSDECQALAASLQGCAEWQCRSSNMLMKNPDGTVSCRVRSSHRTSKRAQQQLPAVAKLASCQRLAAYMIHAATVQAQQQWSCIHFAAVT